MLIGLLMTCIFLDVVRELCFKIGARASVAAAGPAGKSASNVTLAAAWSVGGGVVWGVEILAWAAVLSEVPLNIAFPVMSFTYAATPLASALLLGEAISRRRWLGIGFVTAGVAIVGATGIG
jgi:multidrug transporter EmrE-like cation transporter